MINHLGDAVALTEEGLPRYAGQKLDFLTARPRALRKSLLRQLGRPADPDEADIDAERIEAKGGGRSAATASGLPPADQIVWLLGVGWAWLISPKNLLVADGRDPRLPEPIAVHCASVVEVAHRPSVPAS